MENLISTKIETVIAEMNRLHYKSGTILQFKNACDHFIKYAELKGVTEFNEEFGMQYLQEIHGFPRTGYERDMPNAARQAVHCMRKLGEINQFMALTQLTKSIPEHEWAGEDIKLINKYLTLHFRNPDVCERTKNSNMGRLKVFYRFLGFRRISSVAEVTPQIISDYVKSLQGYATVSISSRLRTLKQYLTCLYDNGYLSTDLSKAVPRVKCIQNLKTPALWSKEQLEKLLSSIERASPVGKRDYAVLLMGIQLGVRCGDIANLKLDNINWHTNEIEFVQSKTKRSAKLPLLSDVGWAIIDYIRHSRPKIDSPYLFLTAVPPFKEFQTGGSVSCILTRQMQKAGIPTNPAYSSGMHSLRHALARRMLENGTPLPSVSAAMCHERTASATTYLRVDIEGMRECTLSVPEVNAL